MYIAAKYILTKITILFFLLIKVIISLFIGFFLVIFLKIYSIFLDADWKDYTQNNNQIIQITWSQNNNTNNI